MGMGTWIRSKPAYLERACQVSYATIKWLQPLLLKMGYERANRWILPLERLSKRALFNCQMCGQCTLHETGMVCPMTCPKHLRNGACGGVRSNGNCEVIPDMRCVWVVAYERAQEMRVFGPEMITIKPPANHLLEDSSAWINKISGADQSHPKGWAELPLNPVIEKRFLDTES
jgi:hypothetical protein